MTSNVGIKIITHSLKGSGLNKGLSVFSVTMKSRWFGRGKDRIIIFINIETIWS